MMFLVELLENDFNLYVDMDGVIVDFQAGVHQLIGQPMTKETKKVFWKTIKKMPVNEVADFWSNLPWTSDGQAFWRAISKYNPKILSSPGTSLRSTIEEAKDAWIQKHLFPRPTQVIFETDKWKYASLSSVLIDDMAKQIDPWVANGGIGILHRPGYAEQSISTLRRILS